MIGKFYINGKDVFTEFGAVFMKGTYEALLKPVGMKQFITNNSRLEHGVRYVANANTAKTNERNIQLSLFISGSSELDYLSKVAALMNELENGSFTLKVTDLGYVYHLVYSDCASYGDYGRKRGKFTLKLIEPNTKDRQKYNGHD